MAHAQWGAYGKHPANEAVVIGTDSKLLKLPMKNKETHPISCNRPLDSRVKIVRSDVKEG